MAGQIESEAKTSPGEVTEQITALWHRHPTRKEWLPQADKLLASAKVMARKGSFDEAVRRPDGG